jgi:hypothetical protein
MSGSHLEDHAIYRARPQIVAAWWTSQKKEPRRGMRRSVGGRVVCLRGVAAVGAAGGVVVWVRKRDTGKQKQQPQPFLGPKNECISGHNDAPLRGRNASIRVKECSLNAQQPCRHAPKDGSKGKKRRSARWRRTRKKKDRGRPLKLWKKANTSRRM